MRRKEKGRGEEKVPEHTQIVVSFDVVTLRATNAESLPFGEHGDVVS